MTEIEEIANSLNCESYYDLDGPKFSPETVENIKIGCLGRAIQELKQTLYYTRNIIIRNQLKSEIMTLQRLLNAWRS